MIQGTLMIEDKSLKTGAEEITQEFSSLQDTYTYLLNCSTKCHTESLAEHLLDFAALTEIDGITLQVSIKKFDNRKYPVIIATKGTDQQSKYEMIIFDYEKTGSKSKHESEIQYSIRSINDNQVQTYLIAGILPDRRFKIDFVQGSLFYVFYTPDGKEYSCRYNIQSNQRRALIMSILESSGDGKNRRSKRYQNRGLKVFFASLRNNNPTPQKIFLPVCKTNNSSIEDFMQFADNILSQISRQSFPPPVALPM